MYEEDQLKRALELDEESGEFVMDEDGFIRFEPSPEELEAINAWMASETDLAEEEYAPIYEEAAENFATYKASKCSDLIDGEQPILPAPLARIAVDQYTAWVYNTITRPTPIVSMQPQLHDTFKILMPAEPETLASMGVTYGMPEEREIPAEEACQTIQRGYDCLLNEFGFSNILRDVILDACTVERGYAKVCWETNEYTRFEPTKINGTLVDMSKTEEVSGVDGRVRWYSIPVFNMLKRVHEDDLDKAEMLQERTPISPEEFRGRCYTGKYHMINEGDVDAFSRITGEVKPKALTDMEITVQNKMSTVPKGMLDVRLVWFYRWLKFKEPYTDPVTGETAMRKVARRVSLYGDFHYGARKMGCIYRNYRNDQLRPYAVCYQLKDPHSDSGSSTASISKWFQKVATHLVQAEIKNVFHANNFTYWYDPDSPVASFFKSIGNRLATGISIPGKLSEDWGFARAGAEHYSLVTLINVIRQWAREAQNMSAIESGDSLPSRTPSSTISQVLQQGFQQPILFMKGISEFTKRLILLDMETRRQFQPMGEILPTRDPKTRQIANIPFNMPTGDLARNLRISLTATDEAMAREHEAETLMMLLNIWQQGAKFVAEVAGPLTNPQATTAQRDLFVKIVSGWQTLFDRVAAMTRTDLDAFDLQSAVEGMRKESEMMMQEAMNAPTDEMVPGQGGPESQPVQPGPTGMAGQPANPADFVQVAPTEPEGSNIVQ